MLNMLLVYKTITILLFGHSGIMNDVAKVLTLNILKTVIRNELVKYWMDFDFTLP